MSAVLAQRDVLHVTKVVLYDSRYREQVLELAREVIAESASHRDMPIDEDKLIEQLEFSLTSPDTIYVRLAVRGGEVLGGLFGVISPVYFSQEKAARDMAWVVKKSSRGTFAAVRLVQDFEAWGLARGVKKFFLGQLTGINMEMTTALYEKLGYRVVGMNAVKES